MNIKIDISRCNIGFHFYTALMPLPTIAAELYFVLKTPTFDYLLILAQKGYAVPNSTALRQ